MDMQNVDSSNVESVGYDRDTQELHVRFKNGSLYKYENVPPDAHEELMAADSVGKHLAENIKGTYDHSQLE